VVSGSVKRGNKLKSSITNEIVRIMRIIELHGRSVKDVNQLKSGQIGGVVFSKPLLPGDIAASLNVEQIILRDISYVQDPVVAISIEPLNIHDISRLQSMIESIVQSTPGLEFEANPDTGELLALGVGTLQLDILKSELIAMEFEIEVSEPVILQFEIPLEKGEIISDKYPNTHAIAGKSSEFTPFESYEIYFSDTHSNRLIISCEMGSEAREGFSEVFRQATRVSPLSHVRMKEMTLQLKSYPDDKRFASYESGMVIASSLLRQVLTKTKSTKHEPYYTIEITLTPEYLGNTLQELQRFHAIIENVDTEEGCSVQAIIPVRDGLKIADVLRQVTDGNVFWSFPTVHFLPIKNTT
jgi:translation elongation factor EF-G